LLIIKFAQYQPINPQILKFKKAMDSLSNKNPVNVIQQGFGEMFRIKSKSLVFIVD
jgi:hypothetical protein